MIERKVYFHMELSLQERIKSEVERLSGNKYTDYAKWQKENYLADGDVVSKFWDLIESAKVIVIIGDYDVDGVCASYIMSTSIKSVYPDKEIHIRIPRRFSEGYGINNVIVEEIKNKYARGALIITVDNGISAGDKLELLEKSGYKVAITDHHVFTGKKLPKVSFLLDPSVKGHDILCAGDYWCGAGVALKLVEQYVDETTKTSAEVFAGIATIADCVPLKKGNWVLVKKTISKIRRNQAPPQIQMLLRALNQDPKFCNEDTIGYYIGPAFNAPGRLEDKGASIMLKFLISNPNLSSALAIAEINKQRKDLRDEQYERVTEYIENNGIENNCPIWVELPNLHEGIVGILAGKIAEDYNVPAIVLTEKEDGTLKGSARTVGNIDILSYLLTCGANFISLGGHPGAAGMTMTKTEFDIGKEYQIDRPAEESDLRFINISTNEIVDAYHELSKFEPFGMGNPAPMFSTAIDTRADFVKMVGADSNHLMATDPDLNWKVTHFHHIPNDLEDKEHFYVGGPISLQGFQGIGMPTLNGEIVFDISEGKEREDPEKGD